MSRRENYGGGQSSLGYLFGSDDKTKQKTAPPATPIVYAPPYGIDTGEEEEKPPGNPLSSEKQNVSNNSRRPNDLNSGKNMAGRPSTKVKSVPGGDSSLGYLFGDKS